MKSAMSPQRGVQATNALWFKLRARRHGDFSLLAKDFVWNATNLSREMRTQVIDLLAAYNACVRIAYVETSHDVLFTQNRSRKDAVPEGVIEKMMDRWQVPDLTEAHQVEHWVD